MVSQVQTPMPPTFEVAGETWSANGAEMSVTYEAQISIFVWIDQSTYGCFQK